MTRRMRIRIALGALLALTGITVAGATSAPANEYFCRPWAKVLNDGIHAGTCQEFLYVPISLW